MSLESGGGGLDARSIEERTRVRRISRLSRETGEDPLLVERHGDTVKVSASTGSVAADGTVTVYLTENRTARGKNLFRSEPIVQVERDRDGTPGGLVRAGEPRSPSVSMDLVLHTNRRVCWDGANEVWSVVVTNDSGSAAGFHLTAMGF